LKQQALSCRFITLTNFSAVGVYFSVALPIIFEKVRFEFAKSVIMKTILLVVLITTVCHALCLANFQELHPEIKLLTAAGELPAANSPAGTNNISSKALRFIEQSSAVTIEQHLLPNMQQLNKPRPIKRKGRLQL
jgi:hypothetical protein